MRLYYVLLYTLPPPPIISQRENFRPFCAIRCTLQQPLCVNTGESSQESSTASSIPTPSASGDETSTPEQGTPGETN